MFPLQLQKSSKGTAAAVSQLFATWYIPYHTSTSDLLPERCHASIPFLPQDMRLAEEVLRQRTVIQDPTTEAEFDKGLLVAEEVRSMIRPLA